MSNPSTAAAATPTTKTKPGGTTRFAVAEYGAKGEVRSSVGFEDPEPAMRKFVELVDAKEPATRERGSYVSITDDQLKFDAASVSEGRGVTYLRFGKPEGEMLYQSTRLDMKRALEAEQEPTLPHRIEATDDKAAPRRPTPPLEESFNVTKTGLTSREYRFRDQTEKVAFSEGMFGMETRSVNQAAIKAMMDRAAERGWNSVHVKGSAEFQRQAWIAAEARSIRASGHEPSPADRAAALDERARLDRATPSRTPAAAQEHIRAAGVEPSRSPEAAKPDPTTRKLNQLTVLIDKALAEQRVAPEVRDEIRQLMVSEAARRVLRGDRINVKIFDPSARRAAAAATVERNQRSREPDRMR